jgi:uncharacterized protein
MISRVSDAKLDAFYAEVGDLVRTPEVQKMKQFHHHGTMTCYNHSMFVAYLSFSLARKWGWDYRAAARGGLLHDLYLYNNRDKSAHPGWQCFDHPVAAWRNAKAITKLSRKEENIILSHMWPFAKYGPHSKEALLVNAVDTFCATLELSRLYRRLRLDEKVPSSQLCPLPL